MNTAFRPSLSARVLSAAFAASLMSAPIASRAQYYNVATGKDALYSVTTGSENTADGFYAMFYNTTGTGNTAIGFNSLVCNTTGNENTATGYISLNWNTTGNYNTATGSKALYYNTTGYYNTAAGADALYYNGTGYENTASGVDALYYNSTGSYNCAYGVWALLSNTEGDYNTANGVAALAYNTTGSENTATGYNALVTNTRGTANTADGYYALYSNTTGYCNVGSGYYALASNTTGVFNTGFGINALSGNTTGNSNIALGAGAGDYITTGSNNIAIGNIGANTDNGVIRLGTTGSQTATYIAGISGAAGSGEVAVYVNSAGQLYTLKSSRRFKSDIKDMGSISAKLMQLRPVTFRYKDGAEQGPHALQYGLIAEEVAKVYPDLVQYDSLGKPYTVYYHLLTPMLLNEFQKEHRRTQEQQQEMVRLKTAYKVEIAQLKSELAALRQTQEQQVKMLAKLSVSVQGAQNKAPLQLSAFTQR